MSATKAIETKYNGYRFRSRLEAKWAVYFDSIGVRYDYESQGYVLDNGECYLPDFYLPDMKTFVEIKPKYINRNELFEARDKISSLAYDENKFAMLCKGDPYDNEIYICGRIENKKGYGWQWEIAEFILKPELLDEYGLEYYEVCNVGIVVGDRLNHCVEKVLLEDESIVQTVMPFSELYGYDRFPVDEQEYAREARFEHGECG